VAEPLETDDEFLAAFQDKSLARWDHVCQMRITWLYLQRYRDMGPRSKIVARLFDDLKAFVNAKIGLDVTFHTTVAYFWLQLIDFHIMTSKKSHPSEFTSFHEFISFADNRELLRDELFLDFYSHSLLFDQDTAAESVRIFSLLSLW